MSKCIDADDLGEYGGDHALGCRDGGAEGRFEENRFGQPGPVDLAVGVEREFGQRDDGGGNHIGGQFGRDGRAQVRTVDGVLADRRVGDKTCARPRVPVRHRDGGAHRRLSPQSCLDLAEFDAEAADLDLEIGALEVFERAVRRHRTISPVRYMRDSESWAFATKGFATKRSAVSTGRFR